MRNLNEHNITEEVLSRLKDTPNARLKEILSSLIRHMHDFARETRLTEKEWLDGILFLTRTGQKCDHVRQEMVLLSDTLGLSQLVVAQNHSRGAAATEQTVFGPFHVPNPPRLRHGEDIARGAPGEPCHVSARVTTGGKPVANATVDVWQADAEGFYDVQREGWSLDNTQLRAIFEIDADGRFSFWTVKPLYYPIPTDGPVGEMMAATRRDANRPGHIHFMIDKPGYDPLITHVFLNDDPYLDSDAVFGVRSSCIGNYVPHEPGRAPDGKAITRRFYTLEYAFTLEPLAVQKAA